MFNEPMKWIVSYPNPQEHFNSSYISKDKAHLDDTVYNKAAGDVLRRVGSKVSQNFGDFGIKTTSIVTGKNFYEVLDGLGASVKT